MMRRREWLRAGVWMAGAFALSGAQRRARGDDPVTESDPAELIKKIGPMLARIPVGVQPLGDHLHMVHGPGGNIAVLGGPEGTLIVDSGIPDRAKEIVAAVEKAGGNPATVLINTHWHFDHAGGNAAFAHRGAKIWATAATRRRLATDQYTEAFKMTTPASPPEALPSVTFDEAEVHVNGEVIRLRAVPPAHTDGDLIVHFLKADVIHAGDLFFNGTYPAIDASSRGWLGGMVAAADRLLKLAGPKTRIIPGHGPLATVGQLADYRRMLAAIHDRLTGLLEAGKTADEAVAARPTHDFDPAWAKGLFSGPMFTRLAYVGLLKHREEAGK